jgi:hypothetical protein
MKPSASRQMKNDRENTSACGRKTLQILAPSFGCTDEKCITLSETEDNLDPYAGEFRTVEVMWTSGSKTMLTTCADGESTFSTALNMSMKHVP